MQQFLKRFLVAGLCIVVAACSARNAASTIPDASRSASNSAVDLARADRQTLAGSELNATVDSAAATGPYRVHAFLEDTQGNQGCLYSGNFAAVRKEADITQWGFSGHGRLPCPASFQNLRVSAGFKTYRYNDIAMVGNAMPISSINSAYYYKKTGGCSSTFISSRKFALTNLGQFATQVAAAANAWESNTDADYWFNDNNGSLASQGVPTQDLCGWSTAAYVAGMTTFINHLAKPQIVNFSGAYNDEYTAAVGRSNAFMVASEEGIPHFANQSMFNLSATESGLNRLLQLEQAGHSIVLIQYNPATRDANGPIEFPSGFSTMYDQRLWNYAGGWTILDYNHFYMLTGNEGNYTNSGATVEPEYYLVPQNPLKTAQAGALSNLQVGNLLVREYRNCYYKAKPIGVCAMVLNPNPGRSTIPRLAQNYGHSVVISGEGAMPALAGVGGGVSTRADDGTLSYTGPKLTTVAAGRAVILTQ